MWTLASLGGGKSGPPRVTPSRAVTSEERNFLWVNLQKIVDKRGRIGKKVMNKKVHFFKEKIRVAAPGDTDPSDATVYGSPFCVNIYKSASAVNLFATCNSVRQSICDV